MIDLTADRLRELLTYDSETGVFRWRVRRSIKTPAGAVAGSLRAKGYLSVKIDFRTYYAHRLAWLYMTGAWPADQTDHINRVRSDNRWINLREATNSGNACNSAQSKESGLPRGVYRKRKYGRFQAQISKNKVWHNLGLHDTAEEAAEAYKRAATQLHGEFAYGGAS